MNRLLFVTLIVLLVISLTGASEEENGENSLKEKESDVSEIIQRNTREAKRKTKRRKNIKKKKNNKAKKKGNNKAKLNRNKKSNKKTKKSKKSKKSNKKKNKTSKRKNRKMKNRKGKKGKKGNGKSKKNKGKKMGRKSFPRAGASLSTSSSSSSCNCTCLDNAMKYLKMFKDKVSNYVRQKKRIDKQYSTSGSKSGKKGLFKPALQRLADAGGGNQSNLSCQGSTTSSGALQLANISSFLNSCSKNIHAACNPSSLPMPGNITKVNECNKYMKLFQDEVSLCVNQTGSLACICWGSSTLKTLAADIKNCSLTAETNAMKAALETCKGNFTICRKYEDEVVSAISSCSKSSSDLIKWAKALSDNVDGITKALNKTSSLSGISVNSSSSTSGRRRARHTRANATSCAEIITKNDKINKIVGQNSASTKIYTLALEVSGSNVTSCSSSRSEATQIAAQVTTLSASLTTTTEALTVVQANLKTQTGTTASSASIAASSSGSATTASSKYRRRRMQILRASSRL